MKTNKDLIDRQAAIDALAKFVPYAICDASTESYTNGLTDAYNLICQLPSVQPDYQEVLGWLLAYHTMSFDLHGRYLPHEVISWLINDFTKEFIAGRGQNG